MHKLTALTISILLFLLQNSKCFAQSPTSGISGTIFDENNNKLVGANIIVYGEKGDTLSILQTDSIGRFTMKYDNKCLRIEISCIGYITRYENITNSKNIYLSLKPATNMIGEIIVKGANTTRKDNKLIIYPNDIIKKNAYDGYSTLNMIDIAGLEVDMFDQTVTTRGNATTLCINGREVKTDEINTINPQDIKRIDYYQTFDPKHPQAKAVIDFIIKNRDHGGMLYTKVEHNVNIAKGNGLVDMKQYCGKSEYEVQLSGNYAHYTPKEGVLSTTYMPFATGDVWKNVTNLPSSARNNGTSLKVAYLYKGGDKTQQTKFNAAAILMKKHNISGINMTEAFNDEVSTASDNRHRDNISPAVRLYYEITSKLSRLTYNFDGCYNHTEYDRIYISSIPIKSLTDQKYTFVYNDFYYSYYWGQRNMPFINVKHLYNGIKTYYSEEGIEKNSTFYNNHFVLFIGNKFELIPQKCFINLNLVSRVQTINNGRNKFTQMFFNPALSYNVIISKKNSLQGLIGMGAEEPDFSYYSEAEQTIDKYQHITGNPSLKTNDYFAAYNAFSHNAKWGNIDIWVQYLHTNTPLHKITVRDDSRNIYMHSYVNTEGCYWLLANVSLTLNIIRNKLKWKGSIKYKHEEDAIQQSNTYDDCYFNTSVIYTNNKITAKAELSTPSRSLLVGERFRSPIKLRLDMTYTHNNWHFTLGMKNPFFKVWKEKVFNYGGFMTSSRQYNPYIDYNVVTIGANYRINYGKKHKFQNTEINEILKSAIIEQ